MPQKLCPTEFNAWLGIFLQNETGSRYANTRIEQLQGNDTAPKRHLLMVHSQQRGIRRLLD